MFFVLLCADRYTGILEVNGSFELFPINGAPPALSFQMPVQQFCGFSVHGGVIVVAYLKKIHVLLRFEIGSLRVAENSIHSISDCHRAVRYAVMC